MKFQEYFGSLVFMLVILVSFGLLSGANKLTLEEELTLTYQQKLILDEFREMMEPQLTQEYMSSDLYLSRWLRESRFNINHARRRLEDNLKWRADNRIDKIREMDWSEFTEDYPYIIDVYDREGRPSFAFNYGAWDIRKAAVTGRTQKLTLYWAKALEELTATVRSLHSQNVTGGNILIDVRDFNLAQHSCPQCIPIYIGFITMMQQRYPGEIHRAYAVNAPGMFEILMQMLRPAMGDTGDQFRLYGTNKEQWQKALQVDFPVENLPPSFGGKGGKLLNDI